MNWHLLLQVVAVTHVAVVDPETARVERDQTVVIEGTRIRAVGPSQRTPVPAGARVIDGTGAYAVPGLWDMHVHMSVPGGSGLLPLFVAYGVTGVRDMTGDLGELRRWQRGVAAGSIDGPRMVISGPYLVGQDLPVPHFTVRSPDDATRAVDSLVRLGVDFIKVHNGMSPESYFAAAREARAKHVVFAGHVFPPVTPVQASDSGQRSLEHLSGFLNECSAADSAAWRVATPLQRFLLGACAPGPQRDVYARLVANGTWVTPTLFVQTTIAELRPVLAPGNAVLEYYPDSLQALIRLMLPIPEKVPDGSREAGVVLLKRRAALTGELQRAGVRLLAGTDVPVTTTPPGLALHDELAWLAKAGLSPAEVLRTATTEPARYLSATDSLGSVASGKVADMVLVDANPLDDVANLRRIRAVIANGRVYDAVARRALIEGAKAKAGGGAAK